MLTENEIKKRGIPDLYTCLDGSALTADNWEKRRAELLEIFAAEEYGRFPRKNYKVTGERISRSDRDYAGKVTTSVVRLTISDGEKNFSFPVTLHFPNVDKKVPLFIFINFRSDSPDKYMPVEEITDRGCAICMIYYDNISLDKNEFESGVASVYPRPEYDWGKITMWAWSMSRAADYLLSDPEWSARFDPEKLASIGHSRLGKTSLWCGANDERFKYVFVNDSGCSGDAVTRAKTGEHVADITKNFPYWFCGGYFKYINNEDAMPFDQHFLVACVAPRKVYGGFAKNDTWADPYSQYLSYKLADGVWKLLGQNGLAAPDRYPEADEIFAEGSIGCHMRSGDHALSRYDWNRYIDFIQK